MFRLELIGREPTARPVAIADGIEIELPYTVLGKFSSEDRELDFELEFDLVGEERLIRPVSVKVSSSDGEEVTSSDLRALPVSGIQAVATAGQAQEAAGVEFGSIGALSADEIELLKAKGPVDESLKKLADRYKFAHVIGVWPAKFVQDTLNLPSATATRWIQRAREKGFLDGKSE